MAVTAASLALVFAAFRDDFSLAYILHHSNRDLPIAYKFAALWSGQEGSLLFWSGCWHLRARLAPSAQGRYPSGGACLHHYCGGTDLLPVAGEFRCPSVCAGLRHHSAGRQRAQSPAAISGDGDSSADALSRLRGHDRAVCVCARGAHHQVSRREMDSHHPALDHGRLGVFDLRIFLGSPLGIRGARLGRILGVGPG